MTEVTQLLNALDRGETQAAAELLPFGNRFWQRNIGSRAEPLMGYNYPFPFSPFTRIIEVRTRGRTIDGSLSTARHA
jgi:hypothetical protein